MIHSTKLLTTIPAQHKGGKGRNIKIQYLVLFLDYIQYQHGNWTSRGGTAQSLSLSCAHWTQDPHILISHCAPMAHKVPTSQTVCPRPLACYTRQPQSGVCNQLQNMVPPITVFDCQSSSSWLSNNNQVNISYVCHVRRSRKSQKLQTGLTAPPASLNIKSR